MKRRTSSAYIALGAILSVTSASLLGASACGGTDATAPSGDGSPQADTSTQSDGSTTPPADAGASIDSSPASDAGGSSDANGAADAHDAAPDHPVTGYSIVGTINYAFKAPYALAVDSADNLYVSQRTDAEDTHTVYLTTRDYSVDISPGEARILQFDNAGTYTGWIGAGSDNTLGLHATNSTAVAQYIFAPGGFNMIRGMTFGADGHMFVLDDWRVQELDTAFMPVRWTGHGPGGTDGFGWRSGGGSDTYSGPLIGGFHWPSCVRLHNGQIWVGNWYWNYPGFDPGGQYNAIDVLDMTTGFGVAWLGGAINTQTAATTTGLHDAGMDGSAPLQPQASVLHSTSPGMFNSPRHFVWKGNKIYVIDDTSDPVLSVFDEQGVMQPGVLNHLTGASEKPFAMAIDKYGNLIVSDMYTGSVRFFTTQLDANGEFTQAAEWQVDVPSVENVSYPIISDFAWDSQDNLYVAASTQNKVYKIKLTY
jgi:hypothetical protein